MKYLAIVILFVLVGKIASTPTPPFPPRNNYRIERENRERDAENSAEDSDEADVQDDEGESEEEQDELNRDYPPPPQNHREPQFGQGGPPPTEQQPSGLSWRGIYEKYWPWAESKTNEANNPNQINDQSGPGPNPSKNRYRSSFRDDDESDEEEDEEELDDSVVQSDIQYGPYRDGQSTFRAVPFYFSGQGRSAGGAGPVVVRKTKVKKTRVVTNQVIPSSRVPVYNNYNTMPYNHRAQVGNRRVTYVPMVYNRRAQNYVRPVAPVQYVHSHRPPTAYYTYRPVAYGPPRHQTPPMRRNYVMKNPEMPMQYYSKRPVNRMRQRNF